MNMIMKAIRKAGKKEMKYLIKQIQPKRMGNGLLTVDCGHPDFI